MADDARAHEPLLEVAERGVCLGYAFVFRLEVREPGITCFGERVVTLMFAGDRESRHQVVGAGACGPLGKGGVGVGVAV